MQTHLNDLTYIKRLFKNINKVPVWLNRESRENRERSRRCNPAPAIAGEPFSIDATVSDHRDGKAAERAGESEDLPEPGITPCVAREFQRSRG